MRATYNGIEVDDAHVSVVTVGVFGFNNPQPHQLIGPSANLGVPVHEGTGVIHVGKQELEEKINVSDK